MNPETENWLKIARNELKTAKVLFREELYLKVIEHSHAALEKIIKGLIVEHNQSPPKIHNLSKLSSIVLIKNVQEDFKSTFEEIDDLYFSVRYPEDFEEIQARLSKEKVSKIFDKVQGIYKMLEKNLQ